MGDRGVSGVENSANGGGCLRESIRLPIEAATRTGSLEEPEGQSEVSVAFASLRGLGLALCDEH